MYMQCVALGHEYTPVTSVSTTKEPTVIFKGYSQLYKRKREWEGRSPISLCPAQVLSAEGRQSLWRGAYM